MKVLTLAFFLALAFRLVAQERPPTISTSFYAFEYVPGRDVMLLQTGGQKPQEFQLSKANIVGPIDVSLTDGVLPIYDKLVTIDGQPTYPLLNTARFPAGLKYALVILVPAPANSPEPYRSLVLNHDLTDFPLGAYRMINVSPHPIRGAIGRNTIQAKPGGIANLEPKGNPGEILPVRFEFFSDERWNLLTETRAAIRDDRRWLTCIYQDPSTGRMNIRSIPDRAAGAPPPPVQDTEPQPEAP